MRKQKELKYIDREIYPRWVYFHDDLRAKRANRKELKYIDREIYPRSVYFHDDLTAKMTKLA